MRLVEKCAPIELVLTDVDGVMTDGRIILDNEAVESKQFHVRDGEGIRVWQHAGGRFGIVTGRSSQVVKVRAAELDIEIVRQGVRNKLEVVQSICQELGLDLAQVCFVGDDLPDLPVIKHVGLGVAVNDAAEEVKTSADYSASLPGGRGAIREVVELLLKNTGRWETAIRKYTS